MAANLAQVATLIRAEPRFRPMMLMYGQQDDGASRNQIAARERPTEKCHNGFVGRGEGKYRAEVFGESHGERGDGAALADGEDHPAIEKCRKLAVGFAQEYVLASSFGIHGRHLSKGEAGEQRDESADEPHAEKKQRLVDGRCDLSGGEEDAGADDASYHQHDGVHQREAAHESRSVGGRALNGGFCTDCAITSQSPGLRAVPAACRKRGRLRPSNRRK